MQKYDIQHKDKIKVTPSFHTPRTPINPTPFLDYTNIYPHSSPLPPLGTFYAPRYYTMFYGQKLGSGHFMEIFDMRAFKEDRIG